MPSPSLHLFGGGGLRVGVGLLLTVDLEHLDLGDIANDSPAESVQVQVSAAGEVVVAIFLVGYGVVRGCGGGIRSILKGLDVQGLLAVEQGEGESLEGDRRSHAAGDGEGAAHSHPSRLQPEQHLLRRVCRGEGGRSGQDGSAVPTSRRSQDRPLSGPWLGSWEKK